MMFSKRKLDYTIASTASGHMVIDKSTLQLTEVPAGTRQLLFSDSAVLFDPTDIEARAYRLYQAAFNRKPDMGGLGFQIDAVSRFGLEAVAGNFLASPEFQSLYSNLDDARFITQLYANVLHRTPDAGGLAYHLNSLAAGLPRANLLAQFSESPENQTNVTPAIEAGVTYFPLGSAGFSGPDEPIAPASLIPPPGSPGFGWRGFNFSAFDANAWSVPADNGAALDFLKSTGANTVTLDWMIEFADDGTMVQEGGANHPTYAEISSVIQAAKARNLRVILKPHVISTVCCGQNRNSTNTDPEKFLPANFFPAWGAYLLDMAAHLPMQSVDAVSIGTELDFLDWRNRGDWESLIASVRAVYAGSLTYDAMFSQYRASKDIEDVVFWDLLDFISCSFYVRLTKEDRMPAAVLAQMMRNTPGVDITDSIGYLEGIGAKYGKQVYVLEGGYQSANGALWEVNGFFGAGATTNADLQSRALDGYLSALQSSQGSWLKGVSLWDLQARHMRPSTWTDPNYINGWGMYQKPSADVVAKWFSVP